MTDEMKAQVPEEKVRAIRLRIASFSQIPELHPPTLFLHVKHNHKLFAAARATRESPSLSHTVRQTDALE